MESRIVLGDAVALMREMDDQSISVCITDPPYGLDIAYDAYQDSRQALSELIPEFMHEALRVCKRVVVFPGIHNVWLYPKADWMACWFYGTTGSWGKYGYNSWQPILLYGKNNRRYGMDTIKYSKMEKRYPGHPCSKPLGLMKLVVERFSEPGDSILDPFCGSGSTLLAAKETGRNYIGIDVSEAYVRISQARVESVEDNQQCGRCRGYRFICSVSKSVPCDQCGGKTDPQEHFWIPCNCAPLP